MIISLVKIEAGISGFESPAAEYTELNLNIDELLIPHPNATFLGVANGDSMNDVGIFNGDILVVDRSLQHEHMNVVVTTYNGSFSCKIYDDINKRLLSASNDYPPIDIDSNDSFIIEGVVTSSIRCHKPNRFSNVCAS